jgi:hypothetical protein
MTMAALLIGFLLAQGNGAKSAGTTGAKSEGRSANAPGGGATAPATAAKKATRAADAPRRLPQATSSGGSDEGGTGAGADSDSAGASGKGGKNFKSKTYSFGAMDVEGKLKTPQLLYFLNRVKLELDMSAPDTRSFMKELEKSADDKNL